jgi:hypothetical protein
MYILYIINIFNNITQSHVWSSGNYPCSRHPRLGLISILFLQLHHLVIFEIFCDKARVAKHIAKYIGSIFSDLSMAKIYMRSDNWGDRVWLSAHAYMATYIPHRTAFYNISWVCVLKIVCVICGGNVGHTYQYQC